MASLTFWRQLFSQVQTLKLPTDYPRKLEPSNISFVDEQSEVQKTSTTQQEVNLQDFCWSDSVTIPSQIVQHFSSDLVEAVLTAYAVLLARFTSEENFLVSTLTSLPWDKNLFLTHVQLNSSEPQTQSFSTVLNQVKQFLNQLAKEKSSSASAEEFVKEFETALQETGENAQQMIQASFGIHAETSVVQKLIELSRGVDFHLEFHPQQHTLRLFYQPKLFSAERVQETLEQVSLILQTAVSKPQQSIYDTTVISSHFSSILPNPHELLPSQWQGSVVFHLEKQASSVPDKIAVIDKDESLTYAKLNSISNQLARKLQQSGVKKGDTVCIFGHRSVSMVWAVAGILKAGASFTVIDPAYPAQRIIDCITVAGPMGAIVIDAIGKLPAKVEKFMAERGDNTENTVQFSYRLLKPCQIEKTELLSLNDSNLTDITLTADDIAVVTFTSGSTGIPKGVLGRHGPLTQYYPWMKSKFGFTSQERFSMQSGISHDPLQRDIFTPWFLGATLYVPDTEDIVNPGRLAQWFKDKRITITHLTPAMGQLLTTGSGAGSVEESKKIMLNDLRYAFFVGDVLNKKFVRRLCSIAPTINVINIYGSTETQRSVSYFVVPRPNFASSEIGPFEKLKDILPVGKGMDGLQALVLSRFTTDKQFKPAGLGELGEIYMRSCHLSKGYRGKPEETAEKFIYNPFIPREEAVAKGDRMYKTGDLGRYLPTGDVECLGRADDQVKIRGFRIELGEINTALSSHNYIKESVTIVRNDLVTGSDEKKIVSYLVFDSANPEVKKADDNITEEQKKARTEQLQHYSHLIKELRQHLRSKLPEYMIPSAFVALVKIPLTPNGKIKKEALPKPDMSATLGDEEFIAPRTPVEKLLAEIWTQVLGVQRVGIHDNFFDLGGHSISATTLTFQVREAISHASKLPVEVLYSAPTIAAMAVAIDQLKAGEQSVKKSVRDLTADTHLADGIHPDVTTYCGKVDPNWLAPSSILLTGCTGFLGAFLLSDLLKHTKAKLYCLARAATVQDAMSRIKDSLTSHKLVWNPDENSTSLAVEMKVFEQFVESRVVPIAGDLTKPLLGMSEEMFEELSEEVDIIIHNGALVHWMYPYEKMKNANVLGTLEIIKMAAKGKLKPIHYVSTTSVFDSDQYSNMSDVFEASDLPYHEDLRGGYAQSKYVAEKLIMNARKNGIPSCIYRPGYVTGHSKTGVSNPDDFLCRMIKGCMLMGAYPDLQSTKLDMTPVDFISRAIVYLCLHEESILKHKAYHMVNPHEFFFNALFETGIQLGYRMKKLEFEDWKKLLIKYVKDDTDTENNPLYPLMAYFSDDFGTRMRTKRPWYDNSNTLEGMKSSGIDCPPVIELMGTYYRFLCQCGFLEPPQEPTDLAVELGFDLLSPRSVNSDNMLGSDYDSASDSDTEGQPRNRSAGMRSSASNPDFMSYKELMRKNRK